MGLMDGFAVGDPRLGCSVAFLRPLLLLALADGLRALNGDVGEEIFGVMRCQPLAVAGGVGEKLRLLSLILPVPLSWFTSPFIKPPELWFLLGFDTLGLEFKPGSEAIKFDFAAASAFTSTGTGLLPVMLPSDISRLPFSTSALASLAAVMLVIAAGATGESRSATAVVELDSSIDLKPAVFVVWLSLPGGESSSSPEMKP